MDKLIDRSDRYIKYKYLQLQMDRWIKKYIDKFVAKNIDKEIDT